MKPFEYEDSSSDEEEQDDDAEEVVQQETEVHQDPREEEKEAANEELIDTSSKPRVEQVDPNEMSAAADGEKEEKPADDLEQDAQDYLSLSLQLVRDFSQAAGVLENERATRRKLFLFLEIDSLLRRAELGKKVSAFQSALEDFIDVIKLCEAFPEKNEGVLASATFSAGECFMSLNQATHALVHFTRSRDLLKADLISQLTAQGKEFGAQAEIELAELLRPSIFDNDKIKAVKSNLEEIQVYIDEIENTADKEQFEKLKAEMQATAKDQEEANAVPEGFGKPQENAEKFLDVTSMIKKKRPRAEFEADKTATATEVTGEDKENMVNGEKRLKLDNTCQL